MPRIYRRRKPLTNAGACVRNSIFNYDYRYCWVPSILLLNDNSKRLETLDAKAHALDSKVDAQPKELCAKVEVQTKESDALFTQIYADIDAYRAEKAAFRDEMRLGLASFKDQSAGRSGNGEDTHGTQPDDGAAYTVNSSAHRDLFELRQKVMVGDFETVVSSGNRSNHRKHQSRMSPGQALLEGMTRVHLHAVLLPHAQK